VALILALTELVAGIVLPLNFLPGLAMFASLFATLRLTRSCSSFQGRHAPDGSGEWLGPVVVQIFDGETA